MISSSQPIRCRLELDVMINTTFDLFLYSFRCSPKPCTLSTQPETLPLSQLGPVISPVATTLGPDAELHTFREALAMSSLSGRRARHGPELYAFVTGEIARHCKRPASPGDVNMESPTHHSKRVRFM